MSEHKHGLGKVKLTRINLDGIRALVIEDVEEPHELGTVEPGWKEGDKKHLDGSETVLWFEGNAIGGVDALMAELTLLRKDLEA